MLTSLDLHTLNIEAVCCNFQGKLALINNPSDFRGLALIRANLCKKLLRKSAVPVAATRFAEEYNVTAEWDMTGKDDAIYNPSYSHNRSVASSANGIPKNSDPAASKNPGKGRASK